jgi:hypothetical protein
MAATVGDHAVVQDFDSFAGGALAKPWNEGVEKAGEPRQKKRAREGQGDALMLEIALADGLRMADEQARKHGQTPLQPKQYIALFFKIIPVYCCHQVNLWEILP